MSTSRIVVGEFVFFGDGKDDGARGGLMEMRTFDPVAAVFGYSLDARSEMKLGSPYEVGRWSGVPTLKGNADAGKVNWILRHGFPTVPVEELGKLVQGKLTRAQAAAATQAAVWRLTNHVKGVLNSPVPDRLVDYLVSNAVDVEEPAAPLSLSPATVTGSAGSPLGPIGISTTGDQVIGLLGPEAVAAGAVLTDGAGNVLSDGSGLLTGPAKNGDPLFVKVPAGAAAGGGTVGVAGYVPVEDGLALVSPESQPLILIGLNKFHTVARAEVRWTAAAASPSPTATPSGSASPSPSPSASATASPSVRPSESVSPSATGGPTGSASPSARPGESVPPSATGRPTGSASPSDSGSPGAVPTSVPTSMPTSAPSTGGVLASTGAGGGIRVAAVAGVGLLLAGGVLALVVERRRRRRYGA
ncbi:Cys-Gln thioester bond-forming surface protein [Kitasatospora purpeofusca]|uniref:TQXA domain-containing protein n=1 Tax=Kitasatospora purpeofusca TaxID=67352 RepID=UPI0035E23EBB